MSEALTWTPEPPGQPEADGVTEASAPAPAAEATSFSPRSEPITGPDTAQSDESVASVILLRAKLAESLGQNGQALEQYRQAERAALTAAEAGAALRGQAALLERRRDRAGAAAALRRLRKREKLKPNEHRRLFRALRASQDHGLIERYVRRLRRAAPEPGNWARIALVFWSAGYLADLFAWAERHPRGRQQARQILLEYSRNSASHGEHGPAIAMLERAVAWNPHDQAVLVELAGVRAEAARAAAATGRLGVLREAPGAADLSLHPVRTATKTASRKSEDDEQARSSSSLARVSESIAGAGAFIGELARRVTRTPKALVGALYPTAGAKNPGRAAAAAAGPDLDREIRRLHRAPSPPRLDGRGWADAGKAAMQAGDRDAAVEAYRRAVTLGGWSLASEVSADLLEQGLAEEAIAVWRSLDASGTSVRARLGALRTMHTAGQFARLFDEGMEALRSAGPFDDLPPDAQNKIVSIVRLMLKCALETHSYARFAAIDHRFAAASPESGLAHWVDGMIAAARLDREAAIAAFEAGLPWFRPSAEVALDLAGEIAVLHARHHLFGSAARAVKDVESFPAAGSAYYERILAPMRRVTEFLGHQEHYPESVIDVIAEELQTPIGYTPEPGRIVTVTATLAQGGSERQLVNVVKALRSHPKVSSQTLLVRSTADKNGFFLPELQGLDVEVYGDDWRTPTDLDVALPMLADRARLRRAIDLLPHSIREEVIRLTRRFFELRPAVVHIRQDVFAAGLACAIAGVPRFFVHRGSLSRNTWVHTPLEADTKLRPMRHTYRKLLESTPFFFVNNSKAGLDTDRDWAGWEDESRFRLVHNAIDFSGLGEARGRNEALRAELAIPPGAKVVGGVFRIVPVKRPQLWIEIARRVLRAAPDTHFLVVGDGHLSEAMRQQGEAAGLTGRLHMPGAVNNIGDWYRCMDAVLLTSEREGLPNANIEAQHFGVPVVSADVGGAAETLDHGVTGFLVDADADPDVYAAQVLRVLNDEPWRARAAATGPGLVRERFDPARVVEKVIDCYGFI